MLMDELGYVFGRNGPALEMTPEWMIRIGEMPFGQNYMALPGRGLPLDNEYTAIQDRSNANFLWFIKFERSFGTHADMYEDIDEDEAELEDFSFEAITGIGPIGETRDLPEGENIIDFTQFKEPVRN